jgi:hypothetical protein
LAFDVVSSWGGQGKWRRSGIGNLKDGVFESDIDNSRQEETGQLGVPCKLRFRVENESNEFLTISGSWSEEGNEYKFEGDLEPKC